MTDELRHTVGDVGALMIVTPIVGGALYAVHRFIRASDWSVLAILSYFLLAVVLLLYGR